MDQGPKIQNPRQKATDYIRSSFQNTIGLGLQVCSINGAVFLSKGKMLEFDPLDLY
jgi:hypothetical protein